MKKQIVLLGMALCLCILTACGEAKDDRREENPVEGTDMDENASGSKSTPAGENVPGSENMDGNDEMPQTGTADASDTVTLICRVVEEDDGVLLLAKWDGSAGEIYRIGTDDVSVIGEEGETLSGDEIEEGTLVEIEYDGLIMDSFPAQLGNVSKIKVTESGFDDLCSLYLDVLEDLWETDQGLNSDITELSVDLSGTRLSPAEQSAVAWQFGESHGIEAIWASYEELVEMGYIDEELLYWENGCLFTITEKETEEIYSLNVVTFDARKWRSGLGAYFFMDCTGIQNERGEWGDYRIGGEAIS